MNDRKQQSKEPMSVARMAQQADRAPRASANAPSPVLWQASSVLVPPVLGSPDRILRVQQLKGNRAVSQMLAVQRDAEARGLHEPSDEEIHSTAAGGIRTPATTLPFLDRLQASFGRHSVGPIKAHVGPEAARASQAMNAMVFASGEHVVFGGTPDLRTAAHEAAHVVQQRAGVQLGGGIGRDGDVYERDAVAVADNVVAGRLAEGMLESVAAANTESHFGRRVQRSHEEKMVQRSTGSYDGDNLAVHVSRDKYEFPLIVNVSSALARLAGLEDLTYTEKLNACRNGRFSDEPKAEVWEVARKLYDILPKDKTSLEGKKAKIAIDDMATFKGWKIWPGLSKALDSVGLNAEGKAKSSELREEYDKLAEEADGLGVFDEYKEGCLLRKKNPNYVSHIAKEDWGGLDIRAAEKMIFRLEEAIGGSKQRRDRGCSIF